MIWFFSHTSKCKVTGETKVPFILSSPSWMWLQENREREITSVLHCRMDQGGVPACSSTSCDLRLLTLLLLWEAVCSSKTPLQCKKVIWLLLFQMIIKKGYFLFRKHLWIDVRRQHVFRGVVRGSTRRLTSLHRLFQTKLFLEPAVISVSRAAGGKEKMGRGGRRKQTNVWAQKLQ